MKWAFVFAVAACSSGKPAPVTNGTATPVAGGCDGARPKIEQLYRDEATANKETPERVRESVADNTHMVMAECAQAPDKVAACVTRVATAREIETQCLAPLDDEGSEGEALRK